MNYILDFGRRNFPYKTFEKLIKLKDERFKLHMKFFNPLNWSTFEELKLVLLHQMLFKKFTSIFNLLPLK